MKQFDRPELAVPRETANASVLPREVGIVLPCYNEGANIDELYNRINTTTCAMPQFRFRFFFIDNASTDDTADKLKELAKLDGRVCVILNARNFGHIRSPFHGLLEASGDCVISMATDLQDPPELLATFLEHWIAGASVVVGQKVSSEESVLFYSLRGLYYRLIDRISDVRLLQHVTGFGLYDRRVIEILRTFSDPYPYLRGMITEVGLPYTIVPYHQPLRRRGITKNNIFTLFDLALLGVTSYSKLPLRLATMAGFLLSAMSFMVAFVYLVSKVLFWDYLPAGYAPAVIGIFFLGSVQIFLIGLIGEYIGAILTKVKNRPLVVEQARVGNWPGHSD